MYMSNLIKKIKSGNVEATFWENEIEKDGNKFKSISVKVEKNYLVKNEAGENEFKKTNNYSTRDLFNLKAVIDLAVTELNTNIETPKE